MGNSFGMTRKTAKVMKITGETIKFRTPVRAGDVVKDYPGLVLLESEEVKHYGVRAKPLEPQQELKPKRLYFLVELPKAVPEESRAARRVRSSGIHMSAKDRLESLMLARRSASDLTIIKASSIDVSGAAGGSDQNGALRLKMRLPRAEVERLMRESKDEGEVAGKIMELCKANDNSSSGAGIPAVSSRKSALVPPHANWSDGHGRPRGAARERRVGFVGVAQGEIQVAVTS